MTPTAQKSLKFGRFTIDPNAARVCGDNGPLSLRPKAFDVLVYLARHPGRIVTKDELIESVWPNVFVTDNSLVQCISDIRAALDDDAQNILKTVARRGYLFAAPVVETLPAEAISPARPEDDSSPAGVIAPGPASAVTARTLMPRRRAPALIVLAAVLCVSVAAVGWWWSAVDAPSGQAMTAAGPDPVTSAKPLSIAVLPLQALGAPATDDYFADGLTEDIIAALGRFPQLSVRAPRTVFPQKGTTSGPEQIGRELKVRYLVEGSVRRSPERIRIAVRLVDASEGTLLWADQYDATPDGLFAIEDDITRRITGALAVRLTNLEQARVAAKPPAGLEAYELVLRGRDLLSRLTRTGNSNARVMFERAIDLDPSYAPAYVGLSRVDLTGVALGWTQDPAGSLQRAEALARKAIAIDEFNPAAHVMLGRAYARLGEYDRALDALKRAVALNPSDPDSYAGLGDSLLWSGDVEGAIKALETAVELDPKLSTEDLFDLGTAYFLAGRDSEAVRVFERPVARNDSTAFIHAMLAAVHAAAGRKDEAGRAAAELRRLSPFFDRDNFGTLFRNPEHRAKIVAALQQAGL